MGKENEREKKEEWRKRKPKRQVSPFSSLPLLLSLNQSSSSSSFNKELSSLLFFFLFSIARLQLCSMKDGFLSLSPSYLIFHFFFQPYVPLQTKNKSIITADIFKISAPIFTDRARYFENITRIGAIFSISASYSNHYQISLRCLPIPVHMKYIHNEHIEVLLIHVIYLSPCNM